MKANHAENAKLWQVPHLNGLRLLRVHFVTYSFARHMHDYFVIGMIEAGAQKFAYRHETHYTPPTGLIVLNPDEPHTGEAAVPAGFRYRALYPEVETMQQIAAEIYGRTKNSSAIPFFTQPVIHDAALFAVIHHLHVTLERDGSRLEQESLTLLALAQLIQRYADSSFASRYLRRERSEVRRYR